MEIKQDSKYYNMTVAQEGDTLEVIEEATEEQGKYGKQLPVKVKCNDIEYTYTPNGTSIGILLAGLGKDTKEWVGKTFQVKFKNIMGKPCLIAHIPKEETIQ